MFNSGVSLADIAAVTDRNGNGNNGNGFGGDWAVIILFFLFAAMGWGGNGFGGFGGGNGTQGALTRGELCQDMNFADNANAVRGLSADLNSGFRTIDNAICTLGYQGAQLANATQMQIGSEFRGLDNAICTLGFNNQAGFNALANQLAQCCCEQKSEAAQTRFTMQQGFCDLSNQLSNATRDILDNQKDQYIRSLENENMAMRYSASNNAQTAEIINTVRPCPVPSYQTCNPWATNGTSYVSGYAGGGCGCGCGGNY